MAPETLSALISASGVILSAGVSLFVARLTATGEIKKMQLSWQREDARSSDDEFSAMVSALVKYANTEDDNLMIDTLQKVAALRAKATVDIGKIYDRLYNAVQSENYLQIDNVLTELLNQKRNANCNALYSHTNKPKK